MSLLLPISAQRCLFSRYLPSARFRLRMAADLITTCQHVSNLALHCFQELDEARQYDVYCWAQDAWFAQEFQSCDDGSALAG